MIATTTMKPSSNGSAPIFGRTENAGEAERHDGAHVRVGEIGNELAQHEEQENRAAEARDRFLHGPDHVGQGADRAGADAIGPTAHEEEQHDQADQAVHEGRVSDQLAGLRIAQRPPRRDCQQCENRNEADETVERKS